jgi:hypothetical protein
MLDLSKIEDGRVYLNITTGQTATGATLLADAEHEGINLEDWVDKEDAGRGRKYDTGKPDWALIPAHELEDVVRVFTMGAEKYGRENWKRVDNGMFRYYSAMMRHIRAYKSYIETGDPEDLYDEESGLHHLAHAMTNAMFLMWLDNNNEHKFLDADKPDWVEQEEREAEFEMLNAIEETMEGLNEVKIAHNWTQAPDWMVNYTMEND